MVLMSTNWRLFFTRLTCLFLLWFLFFFLAWWVWGSRYFQSQPYVDTPQTAGLSTSALPHTFSDGWDTFISLKEYFLCFLWCLSNVGLTNVLHFFLSSFWIRFMIQMPASSLSKYRWTHSAVFAWIRSLFIYYYSVGSSHTHVCLNVIMCVISLKLNLIYHPVSLCRIIFLVEHIVKHPARSSYIKTVHFKVFKADLYLWSNHHLMPRSRK